LFLSIIITYFTLNAKDMTGVIHIIRRP